MNSKSKELRVFHQYCEILGLDVERVEEPPPPEPDIRAVVDGKDIAYELTEAIDPAFASKFSEMLKTQELLRKSFASLSHEKRKQLEAKHDGKIIDLCFRDGVSLRDRNKSLPEIFDYLISIPAEFGMIQLERIEEPIALLDHIAMNQVGYQGICWEPGAPHFWIDSQTDVRKRVIDKMENKQYQTAHPIELIVYFERQPDPPPDTGWDAMLSNVASDRLADSPFRAVWLLNMWDETVCLLAGPECNVMRCRVAQQPCPLSPEDQEIVDELLRRASKRDNERQH